MVTTISLPKECLTRKLSKKNEKNNIYLINLRKWKEKNQGRTNKK